MNLILDNIFIINLLYIIIKFGKKKKTRAERYVDDNGVRQKKKRPQEISTKLSILVLSVPQFHSIDHLNRTSDEKTSWRKKVKMETVAINYESKFASCVSCPAVFSENIQRGARALIRHANSASEKAVMKNTREYNSNKRFTLERNVSLIESRTVALKNK